MGRCRRIRRPSIVHDRAQPVQPSRYPNRAEVFPVLPTVPPQTQLSPGAALRAVRARRTFRAALAAYTGAGLEAGPVQLVLHVVTAMRIRPATTAIMVPAKLPTLASIAGGTCVALTARDIAA